MSLINKIHDALENEFANKSIAFESDIEDEESFAFEAAINPNNGEDPLDSINLTDEEIEQLGKEIEEDLKEFDDSVEEDPDLKEDEDDLAIESLLAKMALESTDEIDDEDLDDGLDAMGGMLDEEIDALIDAGIDIDDLDDFTE